MSKISGIEGMTFEDIEREVNEGARFVHYQFAISIILASFRNSSGIKFIRAGESGFLKALPFSLISFVLGWWGIPWGPIYTVQTLFNNARGGIDVTNEVVFELRHAFAAEKQQAAFGQV